jgi:iron complex outermembrane receptor protein
VVSGTISLVSSRVQRLATRYTGDLRMGDPMLEVPARTLGLAAAWRARDWSATLGAARAEDWVNYDRAALAQAYARDDRARPALVGSELRTYWREYPGVTHLRASVTRDFRGLSAVLTGDNLLDRQRGEPDNVTVLPGRTITAGLRARF